MDSSACQPCAEHQPAHLVPAETLCPPPPAPHWNHPSSSGPGPASETEQGSGVGCHLALDLGQGCSGAPAQHRPEEGQQQGRRGAEKENCSPSPALLLLQGLPAPRGAPAGSQVAPATPYKGLARRPNSERLHALLADATSAALRRSKRRQQGSETTSSAPKHGGDSSSTSSSGSASASTSSASQGAGSSIAPGLGYPHSSELSCRLLGSLAETSQTHTDAGTSQTHTDAGTSQTHTDAGSLSPREWGGTDQPPHPLHPLWASASPPLWPHCSPSNETGCPPTFSSTGMEQPLAQALTPARAMARCGAGLSAPECNARDTAEAPLCAALQPEPQGGPVAPAPTDVSATLPLLARSSPCTPSISDGPGGATASHQGAAGSGGSSAAAAPRPSTDSNTRAVAPQAKCPAASALPQPRSFAQRLLARRSGARALPVSAPISPAAGPHTPGGAGAAARASGAGFQGDACPQGPAQEPEVPAGETGVGTGGVPGASQAEGGGAASGAGPSQDPACPSSLRGSLPPLHPAAPPRAPAEREAGALKIPACILPPRPPPQHLFTLPQGLSPAALLESPGLRLRSREASPRGGTAFSPAPPGGGSAAPWTVSAAPAVGGRDTQGLSLPESPAAFLRPLGPGGAWPWQVLLGASPRAASGLPLSPMSPFAALTALPSPPASGPPLPRQGEGAGEPQAQSQGVPSEQAVPQAMSLPGEASTSAAVEATREDGQAAKLLDAVQAAQPNSTTLPIQGSEAAAGPAEAGEGTAPGASVLDGEAASAGASPAQACLSHSSLAEGGAVEQDRETGAEAGTPGPAFAWDDGYNWRKYGQKTVRGCERPRGYYRCSVAGCGARKKVEILEDGTPHEYSRSGSHNHPKPRQARRLGVASSAGGGGEAPVDPLSAPQQQSLAAGRPPSAAAEEGGAPPGASPSAPLVPSIAGCQESEHTPHECVSSSGMEGEEEADEEEGGDAAGSRIVELKEERVSLSSRLPVVRGQATSGGATMSELALNTWAAKRSGDEPSAAPPPKKKRPPPFCGQRIIRGAKFVIEADSSLELLDDGYRWRKYGKKVVKGRLNPRNYYKCCSPGCVVRKHVERSETDPRKVVTTYEGKHNHDVPQMLARAPGAVEEGGLHSPGETAALPAEAGVPAVAEAGAQAPPEAGLQAGAEACAGPVGPPSEARPPTQALPSEPGASSHTHPTFPAPIMPAAPYAHPPAAAPAGTAGQPGTHPIHHKATPEAPLSFLPHVSTDGLAVAYSLTTPPHHVLAPHSLGTQPPSLIQDVQLHAAHYHLAETGEEEEGALAEDDDELPCQCGHQLSEDEVEEEGRGEGEGGVRSNDGLAMTVGFQGGGPPSYDPTSLGLSSATALPFKPQTEARLASLPPGMQPAGPEAPGAQLLGMQAQPASAHASLLSALAAMGLQLPGTPEATLELAALLSQYSQSLQEQGRGAGPVAGIVPFALQNASVTSGTPLVPPQGPGVVTGAGQEAATDVRDVCQPLTGHPPGVTPVASTGLASPPFLKCHQASQDGSDPYKML